MDKKNKYDAIIIGSGIGGLVCGCYLAKNGLKTLLVEKKSKPGGFCNSFNTKNFHFDGCVHSLGDLSSDGNFYKILNELNVFDKINFIRHNPIDKITSPDHELVFYNNIDDTAASIARSFPNEKKNFIKFLDLILEVDAKKTVARLLNKTFSDILDLYFKNHKLKKMLSLPTFANVGVPAQYLNAFTAIKHYKSFLLDGGYYPEGGIQELPDKLLSCFKEYGGAFIGSKEARKILTKNGIAKGIQLSDDSQHESKYVISACDAKHTFFDLLGENSFNSSVAEKLNKMIPSSSLFIGYLGLKSNFKTSFTSNCNCWYLYDYEYDVNCPIFSRDNENKMQIKWFMILPDYVKKTCLVFTCAPFATQDFWAKNKDKFMELVLSKLETEAPGINNALELRRCVTPHNLKNWTTSAYGSPYGWAATVDQFMDSDFIRDGVIKNLFLSSHWSTIASGVSGVAVVGKRAAEIIVSDIGKKINK